MLLKCLPVSQLSLLILLSELRILNRCLILSAQPIYCCLQLLRYTKYITLQEFQWNSLLTKYFLPVTLQVNMFLKTI